MQATNQFLKKPRNWAIIFLVILIVVLSIILVVVLNKRNAEIPSSKDHVSSAEVQEVISTDYIHSEDQSTLEEYVAEPEQKGEMVIADKEITNPEDEFGRVWYSYDASRDIINDNYDFRPDSTYTHTMKYSVAAGGQFSYEGGTYSVPEKGVLILYPNGELGTKYDYKIENNCLYLKVQGIDKWSYPYTCSED